jgi:imidazolonepropionase-like amidohydrolase
MFAIKAARAIDGERPLPEGSAVIIDGAQIVGVAPPGAVLPDHCEVAEFWDVTVLPGLFDTHVHLCGDGGPDALGRLPDFGDGEMTAVIERSLGMHLASGVTTVRDLGDRSWAVVDWRDSHRNGSGLPTVLASGPPITSPKGHCWNMGGEAQGVQQLRAAVRDRAERGVDVVKIMASGGVLTPGTDVGVPQFDLDELRAVVDEAHGLGLAVTAHAHALSAIRVALSAGVDGLEHCSFLAATGAELADDVVAALVESSIPVCPTLGVVPGMPPPPALAEVLRKYGLTPEDRFRIAGRLHRAGVRLVSGSDAGINPPKPHGVLPEAVIELVTGGVSNADALASATSIAAEACGVADRKGRLRAGLDADLLLVRGDPLTDITALRQVQAVYLAGQRRL